MRHSRSILHLLLVTATLGPAAIQLHAGPPSSGPEMIWVGGKGNWSNPAEWITIPGMSTAGAALDVLIDNGNSINSFVMMDVDASVHSLSLDAFDTLLIHSGRALGVCSNGASGTQIQNAGTIVLADSSLPSSLYISNAGTVDLFGGGFIVLNANSTLTGKTAGQMLVNSDNTIRGAGFLGAGAMGIQNFGWIQADQPFQNLVVSTGSAGLLNNGILRANDSGRLRLLNNVIQNTNGVIEALTGARVDLDGSTVIGGLLTTSDDGLIRANESAATWQNVANAGHFELGAVRLTLLGNNTNDGIIDMVAADTLAPPSTFSELILPPGSGDVQLNGTGTIYMRWGKMSSGVSGQNGGVFIHGSGHTLVGKGQLGMNTTGLVNHGTIVANESYSIIIDPMNSQTMINDGVLRASGTGGLVLTGGNFRNDGAIEVLDGSKCVYTATATELNAANFTLLGTWNVLGDKSPTFILLPSPSVFFNEGHVTLSGAGSAFSTINTMTANAGSFEIRNGRHFTTIGSFFGNSGELAIGQGCRFTASGDYVQDKAGVLRIEVSQANLTVGSAGLIVNGNASLAGTLLLEIGEGFNPMPGQTLHVVTAASVVGTFDHIIAPQGFQVTYVGQEIELNVTGFCDADLDHSGDIDVSDLLLLIQQWGFCDPPPATCTANLDHDDKVDTTDLLILLNAWGTCP